MRKIVLIVALIILQINNNSNAQTIESLIKELPPYFSILTTWGTRANEIKIRKYLFFK